jgi:predicted metal-dependent HD superfamily phosphohydrolase
LRAAVRLSHFSLHEYRYLNNPLRYAGRKMQEGELSKLRKELEELRVENRKAAAALPVVAVVANVSDELALDATTTTTTTTPAAAPTSFGSNTMESAAATTSFNDSIGGGAESLVKVLQLSFAASNGCFAPFSVSADLITPASDDAACSSTEKDAEGCCSRAVVSHDIPLRRTSTWSFLQEQWTLTTQELMRDVEHNHATTTTTMKGSGHGRQSVLDHWWDRLWTLHTSIERHYHTSVHLEEMLHYLQLCSHHHSFEMSKMDNHCLTLVRLAIFFHDAIYDATSSINEQESASLFTEFASQVGIDNDSKESVVDFILATQTHALPPLPSIPCNQGGDDKDTGSTYGANKRAALMLFLDLDMAVLAKDEAAYDQYAALIRNEYHFVPHDVYCAKRADILQTFVQQRPCIYYTPTLAQAWQARAQLNVRREIAMLRSGKIAYRANGPLHQHSGEV